MRGGDEVVDEEDAEANEGGFLLRLGGVVGVGDKTRGREGGSRKLSSSGES